MGEDDGSALLIVAGDSETARTWLLDAEVDLKQCRIALSRSDVRDFVRLAKKIPQPHLVLADGWRTNPASIGNQFDRLVDTVVGRLAETMAPYLKVEKEAVEAQLRANWEVWHNTPAAMWSTYEEYNIDPTTGSPKY